MRITYSPDADALLLDLSSSGRVDRGVMLGPGIVADFDASGRLLSVEILNASMYYPKAELDELPSPEEWLDLRAAALEFNLPESGLRKELEAGRLSGRRVDEGWQVTRHDMMNLMEDLERNSVLDDRSIADGYRPRLLP